MTSSSLQLLADSASKVSQSSKCHINDTVSITKKIIDEDNLPETDWYPIAGTLFRDWSVMFKTLQEYADLHQISLSRKSSYFTKTRSLKLFHSHKACYATRIFLLFPQEFF